MLTWITPARIDLKKINIYILNIKINLLYSLKVVVEVELVVELTVELEVRLEVDIELIDLDVFEAFVGRIFFIANVGIGLKVDDDFSIYWFA